MIRDAGLDAVIGMHPVVHRLRTTVVNPWGSAARGDRTVNAPRQVLLYGVPGCGVSFIANRLADELTDLAGVDCIVLDDLDDRVAADRHAVSAVLSGQELRDVVVVAVSHAPWSLPAELFSTGGFERMAFVAPPDWEARRFRLWELPIGSRVDSAGLDQLVVATEGWAGTDLESIGLDADANRLQVAELEVLIRLISGAVPSSRAWFEQVRALVPMMDSYGRVDDLVGYLQRYRLL